MTKAIRTKKGSALPVLTPLTSEESQRVVKPHIGFEQWVEPLAQVMIEFQTELGLTGVVDLAQMRAALASFVALAQALAEVQRQLALIADSRLLYASKVWAPMMLIYRRAKVVARDNPDVARAIEPFEKWMKHGPHKKAAKTTAG